MTKKHWTAIADAIARTTVNPADKAEIAGAIADAIAPEVKGSFDERTFMALALYNGQ